MSRTPIEMLATVLFAIAVCHVFLSSAIRRAAHRFPAGSVAQNLLELLGEVEVVFGLWAGVLVVAIGLLESGKAAIDYVESLNFTEPIFVFVVMAIAATRPVRIAAERLVSVAARLVPTVRSQRFYIAALIAGPILGSFITEPAAMTVTALLLKERAFRSRSRPFLYITLAVLFVNVSIGGTLTHFAAPPVLMVAGKWGWGIGHMTAHFGWKAVVAIVINAVGAAWIFRRELAALAGHEAGSKEGRGTPVWLSAAHCIFLAGVVALAHHPALFVPIFLFFVGLVAITPEYQEELKLKESLLVGFFLAGLVALGALQRWWLSPVLAGLTPGPLFLGCTGLTGIVDNAALTFLVAQVEGISDPLKYAAVAGAVAGGGLTVIANAPNPAGYSILQGSFGEEGVSPAALFAAAIVPTLVAMICFWFLPY